MATTFRALPNNILAQATAARQSRASNRFGRGLGLYVTAKQPIPSLSPAAYWWLSWLHGLDTNDSRFTRAQGFDLAEEFFVYLRDTFDCLYGKGAERPSMMTIGLHGRLVGRPGRIDGLARFLDHIMAHDQVWICQRNAIAKHGIAEHPYQPAWAGI